MEPAHPHATLALDTDPVVGDESDRKSHEAKNGGEKNASKDSGNTPDSAAVTAIPDDAPQENSSPPESTQPASDLSTNPAGVKRALLSHYILLAEAQLTNHPPRTTPVFFTVSGVTAPTLQSDRENRILFYPGCFNPPHAGHAALLWHTYLLTDASTISVLVFYLPDESLSSKENTSNKEGKDFILTRFQRRQLWKDEILSRFTWIFPSDSGDDVQLFMRLVQRLAWRDGFELAFPTLYGGDHISKEEVPCGWYGGTCVVSDVTRAVDFAPQNGGDLLPLETCGRWKKMQQKALEWTEDDDPPDHWP
jgi:hypothetical protein